jgi:DNA-directed RNA polymerase specialized sigma24 family protein
VTEIPYALGPALLSTRGRRSRRKRNGRGMPMNAEEWLEGLKKLDELIDAKVAEKERIKALLTNTVGSLNGMPHAPGITDKVGNLTVKLITLEEELNTLIDRYVDDKAAVVKALEQLPYREYGVLHRYYIRRMTLEQVAEDMGYCTMHVWRIKESGLNVLQDVMECYAKL